MRPLVIVYTSPGKTNSSKAPTIKITDVDDETRFLPRSSIVMRKTVLYATSQIDSSSHAGVGVAASGGRHHECQDRAVSSVAHLSDGRITDSAVAQQALVAFWTESG